MKTITQNNASTKTGLFETDSFVEHGRISDHQCAKLFSQDQHLRHALSPAQKLGLEPAKNSSLSSS